MLVLGDVVAFVMIIIAFAAAGWSLMMLSSLVLASRTKVAAVRLEKGSVGAFLYGLLAGLPITFLGIAFLSAANGAAKIIGFLILMGLLLIGAMGSGALVRLVAQKTAGASQDPYEFLSLAKASAMLMGACVMPIFGWFFLAPVVLIFSIGAFFKGSVRTAPVQAQAEAK